MERCKVECILLVYVDDILIACPSSATAQRFKENLSQYVQIKDLQACKHILGIAVRRNDQGIHLTQSHLLKQLLADNGMMNCRPTSVPISVSYMQEHCWSGGGAAASVTAASAHQDIMTVPQKQEDAPANSDQNSPGSKF